jgi:cytochrome c peroxidase
MQIRMSTAFPAVALSLVVLSGCRDAPTSVGEDALMADAARSKQIVQSASRDLLVELGDLLFEDERLSVNGNQSCQTCHHPDEGTAAPLPGVVTRGSVVQGSVPGRFGNRKPPSAAYATLSPIFSGGAKPTGGNFWDGRATGLLLGNPAADQALGPFINPVEQGMPDRACVVYRVRTGPYLSEYVAVWGDAITGIDFPSNVETVCTTPVWQAGEYVALSPAHRRIANEEYDNIARAIMAYEASFNTFSSRFDLGQLTAQERDGLKLFNSKGKCQQCHSSKGSQPVFSDFAYHNLGVPKNPQNPEFHFGTSAFDPGLGGFTLRAAHHGRFRTPTVRNAAKGSNRTYMHNGALVSLRQVVDFYNTRDVLPRCSDSQLYDPAKWGSYGAYRCWPAPEHGANLDSKNMGKLGLTDREVDAIVAFMEALTDLVY